MSWSEIEPDPEVGDVWAVAQRMTSCKFMDNLKIARHVNCGTAALVDSGAWNILPSNDMATKLYETLGVSKTATLEESMSVFYNMLMLHILTVFLVRKAYKRKALQTHPDRLPQGSTPEDKANSEEQFRLVCASCLL